MVDYRVEETKSEYIIIAVGLNPKYIKTLREVMMGGLTIESGIATYMGYPPFHREKISPYPLVKIKRTSVELRLPKKDIDIDEAKETFKTILEISEGEIGIKMETERK